MTWSRLFFVVVTEFSVDSATYSRLEYYKLYTREQTILPKDRERSYLHRALSFSRIHVSWVDEGEPSTLLRGESMYNVIKEGELEEYCRIVLVCHKIGRERDCL